MDHRDLISTGKLLYEDAIGHDACGIGGLALRDGKPSHDAIVKSLTALENMEHRGGVCGTSGDGAGLCAQLPQRFFREEVSRLGVGGATSKETQFAVGVFFFLDKQEAARDQAKGIIERVLKGGPVRNLGWRVVPTNDDILSGNARASKPVMEQILLARETALEESEEDEIEHWLYRCRLEMREQFVQAGHEVYVASLSCKMINYKGLLTSHELARFYPDLSHELFESGIVVFHRRYSTNTYPNWTLAQPMRYSCHNGEINTIHTNRNAVRAYARSLEPPLPGVHLLTKNASDSGSLDEWIEHLIRVRGWSLLRALRLSIPPVWDTEVDRWSPAALALFTYCRRAYGSLSAWDGPAGVVATDGRVLTALVDRMGLRPVRWASDHQGNLYVASESGVFGIPSQEIAARNQLQPGQMVALDTSTGERLDTQEIVDRVADEVADELGGDLHQENKVQILVPQTFDFSDNPMEDIVGPVLAGRDWSLEHLLKAHGWDFERQVFVKEMAKLAKEPLSSMGFDRVLTIFSLEHQTLFKYLQQTFAEVTNPPIDPYREGSAMSLVTYLGQSPLSARRDGSVPCRQFELSLPVLSDAVMEEVKRLEVLGPKTLSAVFPLKGGARALEEAIHRLRSEAERAVHDGYRVLILSDKEGFTDGLVPIPSLMALGSVHYYLSEQGLRQNTSLVVQAGDVQEGHDVACLIGFGADAVHPYLLCQVIKNGITFKDPDSKQELRLDGHECLENVFRAMEDSLKKIMSKMGITTAEGYRGARLFEAVGFSDALVELLGPFPSRIGGLGMTELVEDAQYRLEQAKKMKRLGRNRDYMAFNSKVRMALRKAAVGEEGHSYEQFAALVNLRQPAAPRDLFRLKQTDPSAPLAEVEPALDLLRSHFRGAAMSHGALTRIAHEHIAMAMNDLGSLSNSGEGGEHRSRNDLPERPRGEFWERVLEERKQDPEWLCRDGDVNKSRSLSRIRQVASGRFGVDAEYLVNATELQIKIAQGAKPGEGGQLMGKKVTAEIAEIRYGRTGIDLISPPPHHDIYSIEDLAQLIYDLKAIKPGMRVSVKLVAVHNIGTIAVGVAKAGADVIEIDGLDGGTGAAMASSKEHCGLPTEMGLAEAHQALVTNRMRTRVKLRAAGGIKTGLDVIKYAVLGADEFSFGQALMVSEGCIVCKSCHIPNCPTGITGTQGEYKGDPEHVKAYLLGVAEETRRLLGGLGLRALSEATGRSDLIEPITDLAGRAGLFSLDRFIRPDMALEKLEERYPQFTGVCRPEEQSGPSLNEKLAEACDDAVAKAEDIDAFFKIRNSDRAVGASVAGLIARRYGREGVPDGRNIRIRFRGEAGQSFGAWCNEGLELVLTGVAQDGVAKGISGGTVVIMRRRTGPEDTEIQSVAGNNVGYGATGGRIFLGGRAGHRLGIRNSGATIVAEAAGKYCCEYMTRGRVVILGPTENEIGSGMTGGELFVFDPGFGVMRDIHSRSVAVVQCANTDYVNLRPLLAQYYHHANSPLAKAILDDWAEMRRCFRKVLPVAIAHKPEDYITAGANAG